MSDDTSGNRIMDRCDFMRIALDEAKKCIDTSDVPVGAVIVKDGKVIATGRNMKEKQKMAISIPRREASEEINSTNTLNLYFLAPEL